MHTWHRFARRHGHAALAAVLLWSTSVHGAGESREGRGHRAPDPLSLSGFHVTLRPRLDDVFPDTAEYQRAIDRFTDLTGTMKGICDDFARAVQETLGLVSTLSAQKTCQKQVARPYARAHKLGQQYLRIGRELSRHHELVRDLDRMGDSVGLTPDYRQKVKTVLKNYNALLTGYREMKVAFYDQLSDELRFAGCDPGQLLAQADAIPAPGEAPGDEPPPAGESGDSAKAEAVVQEALPIAPAAAQTTGGGGPEAGPGRSGIVFYVDNSRCPRGHQVFLDGQPLGQVSGASREAFHSTSGPHEICLLSQPIMPPGTKVATANLKPGGGLLSSVREPERAVQKCGDPGTIRRSYLHEGWTIALRCE